MKQEFYIPLNYESGKYCLKELLSTCKDILVLSLNESGVLTYLVPEYKTQVRLYGITDDMLNDSLFVMYNDKRQLEYIKLIQNNKEKLVYIHIVDKNAEYNKISIFSELNTKVISENIMNCKEKIARLFIECFYDGEAVDLAAKIGTLDDMRNVSNNYGKDFDTINNSGNYPLEKRIECDNDTLGVILMCSPPESSDELFQFAVTTFSYCIKDHVLELIDKTEDFKFIVEEYD